MTLEQGSQFTNIAGAATTVVRARSCVLRRVTINKAVATGVVTIYDNASAASGTKLATITQPAAVVQSQQLLEYNARMTNGITVVTGAADDITVVWDD